MANSAVKHLQDLSQLIDKLYEGGSLPTEPEIHFICEKAKEVLSQEEPVLKLKSPIVIVGDIHGQFADLVEIFKIAGKPPLVDYLFLGDYVDRGFNSVAVLSLLLTIKARYPQRIWLLRGNHESREINRSFGFYDECMHKYGSSAPWQAFTKIYAYLPLAAVVDSEKFCCHGGLSPEFSLIEEISKFERTPDIPHDGGLCDLLWSDPNEGLESKKEWEVSSRGAGYYFGYQVTETFLHRNNLKCILRAHQLCHKGFDKRHGDKCITIFSAPNYCLRAGNRGAFLKLPLVGQPDFVQFDESEIKDDPKVSKSVPEFFR